MSPEPTPNDASASNPRISFERLRERTDELELIISGLITWTLFSLPGWAIDRYVQWYPQLSLSMRIGSSMAMTMAAGLCYTLALLFAVHIAIRAYWIGLIGLKSVYPVGIQWDRLRLIGPVQRERQQRDTPSIDNAIDAADRAASLLMACITLAALTSLWVGAILSLLFFVLSVVGERLGTPIDFLGQSLWSILTVLVATSLLGWAVDAWLGRKHAATPIPAGWRRVVLGLTGLTRLLMPERLLSPLMLTLQSNTRPRLFVLAFTLAMAAVPVIGGLSLRATTRFDSFGTYTHFDNTRAERSLRSRNYQSLRSELERSSSEPSVPAPILKDGWQTLFLPYDPARDDPVLARNCRRLQADDNEACLRSLWQVELDGRPVSLAGFFAAERLDLGYRGLQGWIPLHGHTPGLHRLKVTWHPQGPERHDANAYSFARREFQIPFLWDPDRP